MSNNNASQSENISNISPLFPLFPSLCPLSIPKHHQSNLHRKRIENRWFTGCNRHITNSHNGKRKYAKRRKCSLALNALCSLCVCAHVDLCPVCPSRHRCCHLTLPSSVALRTASLVHFIAVVFVDLFPVNCYYFILVVVGLLPVKLLISTLSCSVYLCLTFVLFPLPFSRKQVSGLRLA